MIKIKVLQMDKLDKGLCDIFNLNFDTKQVSIIEKINVTNTRSFKYLKFFIVDEQFSSNKEINILDLEKVIK